MRAPPREREQKRIAGRTALPLSHLAGRLSELLVGVPRRLPADRPLLVCCTGSYPSSIAASLLLRHAFIQVAEIAGGMAAWEAARLPPETGSGA